MEDFDELTAAIYSMNPMTLLGIAVGVGILFVLIIAYDSYRRGRRGSRMTNRAGHHVPSAPPFSNTVRNIRNIFRSADAEFARRRRHREHGRERDRHR